MNKLITYLKIKHTSLAAESVIIKREEQKSLMRARRLRSKQKDDTESMSIFVDLRDHRKRIVAFETRAANLARAYLTGKAYETVETRPKDNGFDATWYYQSQLIKRVAELVAKYENTKAYLNKNTRRSIGDVEPEIRTWMGE